MVPPRNCTTNRMCRLEGCESADRTVSSSSSRFLGSDLRKVHCHRFDRQENSFIGQGQHWLPHRQHLRRLLGDIRGSRVFPRKHLDEDCFSRLSSAPEHLGRVVCRQVNIAERRPMLFEKRKKVPFLTVFNAIGAHHPHWFRAVHSHLLKKMEQPIFSIVANYWLEIISGLTNYCWSAASNCLRGGPTGEGGSMLTPSFPPSPSRTASRRRAASASLT